MSLSENNSNLNISGTVSVMHDFTPNITEKFVFITIPANDLFLNIQRFWDKILVHISNLVLVIYVIFFH